MICWRATLRWLNSRGNFCSFRMCLLFWLLWGKRHALPVPVSQMFKWRQCGRILWFSKVLPCPCSSQPLQWYHRTGRPLMACGFLLQLYSDLALCAAQRTLLCGFRLFYLTCYWSADKERCCCPAGEVRCSCVARVCLILASMSACAPIYTICSAYESIFNPRLWRSPTLTNNQLLCFFFLSPSFFFLHNTIRKVTFCWRVSYSRKCETEQSTSRVFISSSHLKIACSSSSSHFRALIGPLLS